MICEDGIIEGDVQIGTGTVVHPNVTLASSETGTLVIGERNVIEDR